MKHFMGETLEEIGLRIRTKVIGITGTAILETDLIKTDQEVWEETGQEVAVETDPILDTSRMRRETDQDLILRQMIGRDIDMIQKEENTNRHQNTLLTVSKFWRMSTLILTSTYLKQKLSTWGS